MQEIPLLKERVPNQVHDEPNSSRRTGGVIAGITLSAVLALLLLALLVFVRIRGKRVQRLKREPDQKEVRPTLQTIECYSKQ